MNTRVPYFENDLLPDRDELVGPVARARLRRTLGFYLLAVALGAAAVLTKAGPALHVAGVSLWFPGAGFLSVGGWWALLLIPTIVLFLAAVFLWFASGNVVAPLLVWGGSLALATWLAPAQPSVWGTYAAAFIVVAFLAWSRTGKKAEREAVLKARDRRNAYLPQALRRIDERALPAAAAQDRELTPEQLSALRYVLDRALQPRGEFKGFNIIEQFQPSAIRYQLNHLSYVLAIAQCQYAPSFHGYLSQAQRNCIDQLTLPKVWSYWRLESYWGHLRLNYDPVSKDNIMLTGWSGICINTYMSNTGDMRYTQDGSLTFSLPRGRSYRHDAHSFLKSLTGR